jgi:hypothetical protein
MHGGRVPLHRTGAAPSRAHPAKESAAPTLVLERGGHAALWEDPVAGAAALLAFLAG